MKRLAAILIAVAGVVSVAAAGHAQTIAQVAASWGLVGTWKVDCGQATSSNNAAQIYVVRDGRLFLDRDFVDSRDSSPIVSARVIEGGAIEIIVQFGSLSQVRQFALMRAGDGRIRALYNRNVDTDQYTIRDGIVLGNGQPSVWQTRCRL